MYNEGYLKHYGIPGMHWGRRKGSVIKTSISLKKANKEKVEVKPSSEDHLKKVALKGKKLHEMTNAELKTFNERMQLERQYKDLSKVELTRGQKLVKSVIDSAAKGASDAAMNYVNKQSAKLVEDLIKKSTSSAK